MPAASRQGSLARIVAQATRTASHAPAAVPPPTEDAPLLDAARLRVGVYCRYSSHQQDSGFSLEAQHEAAEREAATVGTWAIRYYDEPATSAYTDDLSRRPMFLRMLTDARDGQLDMIVVHRLDRFSRNMSITTAVVPALLDAGVQFLSLTERLDAATPAGLMMLHTIGAVAQYESGHKAVAIRNGKAQRAKLGLHTCRPPYGYRWNGAQGVAEPDTPPDPQDTSNPAYSFNGLMRLLRLAQTSLSDHMIATRLNAEGYRQTTPSRVRNPDGSADTDRLFHRATVGFIRRNVYYRPYTPGDTRGTIRHRGAEFRGQHPAALDWDTWQHVQRIAHNRRRGFALEEATRHIDPTVPHTAEFRGLAVCSACGHRLYVTRTLKGARMYEYYVCRDTRRDTPCARNGQWTRVEDVRGLWLAWVREQLRLPDDWRRIVRERLQETQAAGGVGGNEANEARRSAAHRQMERLRWQEKRDRAVEVYAEGLKDRAWMEARVQEADTAILALERAERPQAVERTRLLDAGRFLIDIADAWERATTEQRIVLASHLIAPGGLHIELRGAQGRGSRWQPYVFGGPIPPSGAIVRVDLQPAFRDLLATLQTSPTDVA